MKRAVCLWALVTAVCICTQAAVWQTSPCGGAAYLRLSADKKSLLQGDYASGKESEVVVLSTMRGTVPDSVNEAVGLADGLRVLLVQSDSIHFVYNLGSGKCDPLSRSGVQSYVLPSPDGKTIAFVRGNDIYLKRLEYDTELRLTSDGCDSVFNGICSKDKRLSLGIGSLMAWAPDGMFLLYAKNERVYMYSLQYKWHRQIKLSQSYPHYLTALQWIGQEQLAVMYLNQTQNQLQLDKIDANSLVAKSLYRKNYAEYVDVAAATQLQFLPDGRFVVVEQMEEGAQAVLYSAVGTGAKTLTKGLGSVCALNAYDALGKRLFCQVHTDSLGKVAYAVSVEALKPQLLYTKSGTTNVRLSLDYAYAEVCHSSLNQAPQNAIISTRGKTLRTLETNNRAESTPKRWTTLGGLPAWVAMPTTAPKACVFWVTQVADEWQLDLLTSRLLEQGYAVVAVASKPAYAQLVQQPAAAYVSAARDFANQYAQPLPLVIMGSDCQASVAIAALMHPDTPFAGAVAVAPLAVLSLAPNLMAVERYMRKEGVLPSYKNNEMVQCAPRIPGRLLLLQAENDTQAPQQFASLSQALVEAEINFDSQWFFGKDASFTYQLQSNYVFRKVCAFINTLLP